MLPPLPIIDHFTSSLILSPQPLSQPSASFTDWRVMSNSTPAAGRPGSHMSGTHPSSVGAGSAGAGSARAVSGGSTGSPGVAREGVCSVSAGVGSTDAGNGLACGGLACANFGGVGSVGAGSDDADPGASGKGQCSTLSSAIDSGSDDGVSGNMDATDSDVHLLNNL